MNTFFRLIDTIQTPHREFDPTKYNTIVNSFGVREYDDFISHFAFFLYEYPLTESLQKVFNRKDTSGKVGVTVRHLIKVAKQLDVDQNLIDYYFEIKNDKKLSDRILSYSEDTIENENWSEDEDGKFDLRKYSRTLESYSERKGKVQVYRRQFNSITFTLIKSVLESK